MPEEKIDADRFATGTSEDGEQVVVLWGPDPRASDAWVEVTVPAGEAASQHAARWAAGGTITLDLRWQGKTLRCAVVNAWMNDDGAVLLRAVPRTVLDG